MPRFEVWHRNESNFRNNTVVTLARFPTGFTHVASVDTDDVNRVFELTNHIDIVWWENPGVTIPWDPDVVGVRSTSVGDVIVGPDGHFSVESIGLRKFRPLFRPWEVTS